MGLPAGRPSRPAELNATDPPSAPSECQPGGAGWHRVAPGWRTGSAAPPAGAADPGTGLLGRGVYIRASVHFHFSPFIRAKARVDIPENAKDLLDLAQAVLARHKADGAESVLAILKADWTTVGPLVAQGLDQHAKAENYRLLMEKAYEERDLVEQKVRPLLTRSRDILTGAYGPGNMRKLGDHGFTVDDPPRAARPARKAPTA